MKEVRSLRAFFVLAAVLLIFTGRLHAWLHNTELCRAMSPDEEEGGQWSRKLIYNPEKEWESANQKTAQLIAQGKDVNEQCISYDDPLWQPSLGNSPLWRALERFNVAGVKLLLKAGATPNFTRRDGTKDYYIKHLWEYVNHALTREKLEEKKIVTDGQLETLPEIFSLLIKYGGAPKNLTVEYLGYVKTSVPSSKTVEVDHGLWASSKPVEFDNAWWKWVEETITLAESISRSNLKPLLKKKLIALLH